MIRQLILGYGRDTEPQRIIFSALSFWAWYDGDREAAQTIIFTDRPAAFEGCFPGLPVVCWQLTPENMAQMRGPQQFVHRIKLCIIDEIARQYPGDSLLYCDSDTFFISSVGPLIRQLQPGVSLMHTREYRIADAGAVWASFLPSGQDQEPRKFAEVVEQRAFEFMGAEHRFQPTQYMWNAGIIGLTGESAATIPELTALTDAFFAASGWAMSEQMAFSLGLQASTQLLPATPYVFHYWGRRQKEVMDGLLAEVLTWQARPGALPERLARVRKLTGTWQRAVKTDEARQSALLAFARGEVMSGVKQVTKVLLANSLDVNFAKESLLALRKKSTSQ